MKSLFSVSYLFAWSLAALVAAALVHASIPVAPARQIWYVSSVHGKFLNRGTSADEPIDYLPQPVSHCTIYIESGSRLDATAAAMHAGRSGIHFEGLEDVTIAAYGDAAKPWPVISANNGNIFSFDESCSAITINGIGADSPFSWTATAGGYRYHSPAACFGDLHGRNLKLNVQEWNLAEGVEVSGVNGLDLQFQQMDPLGMPARCALFMDVTNLLLHDSTALNSVNESPVRATGAGIRSGTITKCMISQQLDPAHGRALAKSALELRQCSQLTVSQVALQNAELSLDTDTTGVETESGTFTNITIRNSFLTLKTGVTNCSFDGLNITANGTPAIALTMESQPKSLSISNATLTTTNGKAGAYFWSPGSATFKNVHLLGTAGSKLWDGSVKLVTDAGGNKVN